MTNNWIEQFEKQFLTNDKTDWQHSDWDNVTVDFRDVKSFITTLLEKQREEYVEMITNLYADDLPSDDVFNEWENGRAEAYVKVINLLKSHDKTS